MLEEAAEGEIAQRVTILIILTMIEEVVVVIILTNNLYCSVIGVEMCT